MRNKMKKLITLSVLTAALAGFTACGSGEENRDGSEETEQTATQTVPSIEEEEKASAASVQMPAFSAIDLNGNTVTEEIFGEKDLTVVNVWGTFCSPCIGEMPELGEWADSMPDNVQIVGLIIDISSAEDKNYEFAQEIVSKADAEFTHIVANEDFYNILSGIVGVPTTFFVDKDGYIVGSPVIGADVDAYKSFVEEYLNGQ